ncbi:MAG: hypothetical protein LUD76_10375 [Alistipes sp.]|nr:hypothetical protein [Alistipes sp.]
MDKKTVSADSKAQEIIIRAVSAEDIPGICSIYNHYIENTAVTFETRTVP